MLTKKMIIDTKIDSRVTNFFVNNPEFIFLKLNNKKIEIPVVCFIGGNKRNNFG